MINGACKRRAKRGETASRSLAGQSTSVCRYVRTYVCLSGEARRGIVTLTLPLPFAFCLLPFGFCFGRGDG